MSGFWLYNKAMKVLEKIITKKELLEGECVLEGPMVKAVVDVRRGLIGIGSELHVDIEQYFLKNGSYQEDLWGINFYPEEEGKDFVEFDSMINIRPRQGNKSRTVENEGVREKIMVLVGKWVQE